MDGRIIVIRAAITGQAHGGRLSLAQANIGPAIQARTIDGIGQTARSANIGADRVCVARDGATIKVDTVHRQPARPRIGNEVPGHGRIQSAVQRSSAAAGQEFNAKVVVLIDLVI